MRVKELRANQLTERGATGVGRSAADHALRGVMDGTVVPFETTHRGSSDTRRSSETAIGVSIDG